MNNIWAFVLCFVSAMANVFHPDFEEGGFRHLMANLWMMVAVIILQLNWRKK